MQQLRCSHLCASAVAPLIFTPTCRCGFASSPVSSLVILTRLNLMAIPGSALLGLQPAPGSQVTSPCTAASACRCPETHRKIHFPCLLWGFGYCGCTVAAVIAPHSNQNQTSSNIPANVLPHTLAPKRKGSSKELAPVEEHPFLHVEIQRGDDFSPPAPSRALNLLKENS